MNSPVFRAQPYLLSSNSIALVVLAGVLIAPGSAIAGPDHGPEGVVHSLHDDLDTSAPIHDVGLPPNPVPHGTHSLHVEFNGGTNGGRQTAGNCNGAMTQPFGNDSKAAAIYQAVIEDWAMFDVTVTDTVPAGGTYTTVLTGSNGCCGALGVAPVICGSENLNAVAHVCQTGPDVNTLAAAVSQEAAHTYGLMHVNDQQEIMNPYASGTRQSFKDDCYSYNPGYCSGQRQHCGNGDQNSVKELLAIFGDAIPDTAPPTVSITYPTDGEQFAVGASFVITAQAEDDKQVVKVDLFADGSLQSSASMAPYEWGVTNIPEGMYSFHAVAHDLAGNQTESSTVTIQVGEGDGGDGGDDGGDDGGGDDGGDDGAGDDGGDGGGPGDLGGEEKRKGCGCTTTAPANAAWGLLLLGLLGLRRRS